MKKTERPQPFPHRGYVQGGIKYLDFRLISGFISQTIQDVAIVTIEDQKELVCDPSNGGAMFSDSE